MMKTRSLMALGLAVAALSGASSLEASTLTVTGNFAADNSFYMTTLDIATTESLSAYTTSYAGGVNLNGTTTSGGGFVPQLTLFAGSSGNVIAVSSGKSMCGGMAGVDAVTGLCNDAFLQTTLMPGTYALYLTEFPNTADPSSTSSPTFLFSGNPTITGDSCSVPGGMFIDTTTTLCTQRTSAYALNISTSASAVPEPATLWLAGGTLLALGVFGRRKPAFGN